MQKATDLNYQLTNFNIKPDAFSVLPQISAQSKDDFRGKVNKLITPGTILVTTRQPSNAATRSSRDFKIIE